MLQLDDAELRKVLRQFFQVIERGAAPAVNALVVIAHGGEARAAGIGPAHQQLEQFVLDSVGVLVFVHQHMAQRLLPFLAHLGVVLQELERQGDQVVKVHALVGQQAFFVTRHDHGGAAVGIIQPGLCQGGSGVQALVLPQADLPLPLARHGGVGRAATILEQAEHIVAIENAEIGLEVKRRAIFAQHAHAQRVKGANDHLVGGLANQALGAFAHFGGGLVGEGDGGNAAGGAARLNQPRDFVRDHARFARARARQHQAGAVQVIDCFLLGDIQAVGHGAGAKKPERKTKKGAMIQGGACVLRGIACVRHEVRLAIVRAV